MSPLPFVDLELNTDRERGTCAKLAGNDDVPTERLDELLRRGKTESHMRDIIIETRILHTHERLEDASEIVLFYADTFIAHRDLIEPEALVERIELTRTQHDRTSFGRKGRSVFDDRSQSAIEIAEI